MGPKNPRWGWRSGVQGWLGNYRSGRSGNGVPKGAGFDTRVRERGCLAEGLLPRRLWDPGPRVGGHAPAPGPRLGVDGTQKPALGLAIGGLGEVGQLSVGAI